MSKNKCYGCVYFRLGESWSWSGVIESIIGCCFIIEIGNGGLSGVFGWGFEGVYEVVVVF